MKATRMDTEPHVNIEDEEDVPLSMIEEFRKWYPIP